MLYHDLLDRLHGQTQGILVGAFATMRREHRRKYSGRLSLM